MFELKNVSKSFGDKKVLENLDFTFSGNKLAYVGLNGVGKTTSMNIILGLDKKISGSVVKHFKNPSVQFSKNSLPEFLSINEFCNARKIDLKKVKEIAQKINVVEYLDKQIRFLSFGTQMKMNLIYALVQNSDMVFLDEPTNGLDYETVYNLIKIVKNDPRKFFIISHDINFIEGTCDQLCVLHQRQIKVNVNIGENPTQVKTILNDILEGSHENNTN